MKKLDVIMKFPLEMRIFCKRSLTLTGHHTCADCERTLCRKREVFLEINLHIYC